MRQNIVVDMFPIDYGDEFPWDGYFLVEAESIRLSADGLKVSR